MAIDPADDHAPDEGGGYLVSVSDLMIGLLFVFLLMLMIFALQYRHAEQEQRQEISLQRAKTTALQKELDALAQKRRAVAQALITEIRGVQKELTLAEIERTELLEALGARLRREGIAVQVIPASGVLRLEDSVLFPTLSADLFDQPLPAQPDALSPVAVVSRLAAALVEIVPCYATGLPRPVRCPKDSKPILDAIFVEGHTDNRPIGPGAPFVDNYQLSTERALSTYRALLADQPPLADLHNAADEKLLGLSGYGPDRPISRGATREDNARNRRIDLRFLLTTPPPSSLDPLLYSLEDLAAEPHP